MWRKAVVQKSNRLSWRMKPKRGAGLFARAPKGEPVYFSMICSASSSRRRLICHVVSARHPAKDVQREIPHKPNTLLSTCTRSFENVCWTLSGACLAISSCLFLLYSSTLYIRADIFRFQKYICRTCFFWISGKVLPCNLSVYKNDISGMLF